MISVKDGVVLFFAVLNLMFERTESYILVFLNVITQSLYILGCWPNSILPQFYCRFALVA